MLLLILISAKQFRRFVMQMVDGETTPPPLLQEADLIGLMDKHGIGERWVWPV